MTGQLIMAKENLSDYFLDLNPPPAELRNGIIRSEVIQFVNSQEVTSFASRTPVQVLTSGMVSDRIYFVEIGYVIGFNYDVEKDYKNVSYIWNENSLMTDVDSFVRRKPSHLYIEVMPHSKLKSISYQQLNEMFDSFPFTRQFLETLILDKEKYGKKIFYEDNINISAWERYKEMKRRYPKIEQMIAKEVIASFLDVTPQHLSRMIREKR